MVSESDQSCESWVGPYKKEMHSKQQAIAVFGFQVTLWAHVTESDVRLC